MAMHSLIELHGMELQGMDVQESEGTEGSK